MVFTPSKDGRVVEQTEDPRVIRWDLKSPEGKYDLTSFHAQDFMAWETQGNIFDRSQENIGSSDAGITMYRKLLREQIEIVEQGGEPMALVRDPEKNRIITFPGSRTLFG
jgi:5,5'-dehydrodivanillate O-demethylase